MPDTKHKSRARNRRRRCTRNWAELPGDILSVIFRKLGAIDVLRRAQAVCRPWRQLAMDPAVWRCIDMRHHADLFNEIDMEKLARVAVDRSAGHVEEFYADYFGSDDLLNYIADRTTGLRVLVLISSIDITEEGLAEFAGRCPLLEELEITFHDFTEEAYGAIGRARPELKHFRLNTIWCKIRLTDSDSEFNYDSEAVAIANNMPQLRELQLIGNQITNKGLQAILDNCCHLESLDIRACLNVNVDAGLKAKLARISNVRLPYDSTSDYGHRTGMDGDGFGGGGYPSGYSNIELGYDDMFSIDSYCSYDDFTVADYFDEYDDDGFPYFLM